MLVEEEGRSRDLNTELIRTGRDLQDAREEGKILQNAYDQARQEKQTLVREKAALQLSKGGLEAELREERAELASTQAALAARIIDLDEASALAVRRAVEMDGKEAS